MIDQWISVLELTHYVSSGYVCVEVQARSAGWLQQPKPARFESLHK
jgi:hypothetical protein